MNVLNNKVVIVGVFFLLIFSPFLSIVNRNQGLFSELAGETLSASPNLTTSDTSPTYLIRNPSSYDIEDQSLTIYGNLSCLVQESNTICFQQDFISTSFGLTYAIFTISLQGLALDENYTLNLNWEAYSSAITHPYNDKTQLNIYIEYLNTNWIQIHNLSTPCEMIDRTYGWYEYSIPQPYSDYLNGDEVRVKFELINYLTNSFDWCQNLYIRWFALEIRKDIWNI